MVDPKAFWEGEGGAAYTERNVVNWEDRRAAFELVIPGDGLSILEVGANKGHNLCAIDPYGELTAVGIDINPAAIEDRTCLYYPILRGSATDIPAFDASFDLVFTCGVLIHVPPQDISKAYDELVRVSRKYVLVMEYFAEDPTPIQWRGQDGLLWKRDFGYEMTIRHPEMQLEASGFLDKSQGFDDVTWWRWRKP